MKPRVWIFIVVIVIVSVSLLTLRTKQLSMLEKKREVENSIYGKASSPREDERQEALKDLESFTAEFSDSENIAEVWHTVADIYQKQEDFLRARNTYRKIMRDYPDSAFVSEIQEKLWDLNIKILFSPLKTEGDVIYEVKTGDSLDAISKKFNTTVELIMKSNNLKTAFIRQGKRLKISTDKYSVLVDNSQKTLVLKANGQVIKTYTVSTGKDDVTPRGNFTIVTKLVDPVWYKAGAIVLPDSPENILGSRWMGISVEGYGIHGTTDPRTLGSSITQGCIRMANTDVEELYAILPRGTEVIIID